MNFRQFILPLFLMIALRVTGQVRLNELPYIQQAQNKNIVGELYTGVLQSDTYFNPDWLEGDLVLEKGEKISNVYLRYNGLTDELFWREPVSDKIIKVDKESVKGFHFNDFRGDTTVHFRRMKIKKNYVSDSTLCFLQEIDFLTIRLYIYHSKFFLKRETYTIDWKASIRDVYIEEPIYFIESDSRLSVFKKFNRHTLCTTYPYKCDVIRKYIMNSASGKIKTHQEIISILQYLDSYF